MRRSFLILPLCMASAVALAAGAVYSANQQRETGQALAGGACTSLSGTSTGMDLTNVNGWRVIASAPSGQTFTGGTLQCCLYSPALARWMSCDSSLNITLTSGARDVPGLDNRTAVGRGRVKYLGNSVTLSGAGTTFDLTYEYTQQ